jgi:hypothetical protein
MCHFECHGLNCSHRYIVQSRIEIAGLIKQNFIDSSPQFEIVFGIQIVVFGVFLDKIEHDCMTKNLNLLIRKGTLKFGLG